MTRVTIIVEGQTEERFVSDVLDRFLWRSNVHAWPVVLGGNVSYARVKRHVIKTLKQDRTAYCTTMIDYYGRRGEFPGNSKAVETIEKAILDDICAAIPDFRPDVRFLPYLQLHEFEALLFSDPSALAQSINQPPERFEKIRSAFQTPEGINDDPATAPSKRIAGIFNRYDKVLHGSQAAKAVTIDRMRGECPRFRQWTDRLAAWGSGA